MDELHAFPNQTGCSKHKHVIYKQSILTLCSNSNILVPRLSSNFTDDRRQFTYRHVWDVLLYLYYTHRLGHYSRLKFRFRYFWRFSECFGCAIFLCVDNFWRSPFFVGHIKVLLKYII